MSIMQRISRRVVRELSMAAWRRAARRIEATPPIVPIIRHVTILSMVGHRDLDAYLVAVKSFHRYLPASVEVLDDGTLSVRDRDRLQRHIRGLLITSFADVPADRCQRGGCWERLYRIADRNRDEYVIQLDSDTITRTDPTEVRDAVAAAVPFVISGDWKQAHIVDYASAADHARTMVTGHMQRDAEMALPGLTLGSSYVRGCAGFCGFPPGTVRRDLIEGIHREMADLLGTRWTEWGSEQVMSNLIIANSAGSIVLPSRKYCTHGPETLDIVRGSDVALVHFLGGDRFAAGNYRDLADRTIAAMREDGTRA
jgi:hypothetical protein